MDQKQSDERHGLGSPNIPVMLVVTAFQLKSTSWIIKVITGGDRGPAGSAGAAGHLADNLHDLVSGAQHGVHPDGDRGRCSLRDWWW